MLERKSSALFAKSVFYEDVNDVDVYVEDTAEGYTKIYATFLSRLLGLSIGTVFPLGNRSKVVERCQRHDRKVETRKSVFVVDGDLFLLSGEKYEIPEDLVVLNRYCIENVLIDEKAFVELMDEEDPRSAEELSQAFAYEEWRTDTLPKIRKLFTLYAVAFHLDAGLPTVSRSVKDFTLNDKGQLSQEKIDTVYNQILAELGEKFSESIIASAFGLVESKLNDSACFIKKYVSAKDYTLPLLVTRARSIIRVPLRNYSVKIKLAKNCDLADHQELKERILEVIGMSNAPSQ